MGGGVHLATIRCRVTSPAFPASPDAAFSAQCAMFEGEGFSTRWTPIVPRAPWRRSRIGGPPNFVDTAWLRHGINEIGSPTARIRGAGLAGVPDLLGARALSEPPSRNGGSHGKYADRLV